MMNKKLKLLSILFLVILLRFYTPTVSAIVNVLGSPENLTATIISGTHNYELD